VLKRVVPRRERQEISGEISGYWTIRNVKVGCHETGKPGTPIKVDISFPNFDFLHILFKVE
jgi:hypothetical protein